MDVEVGSGKYFRDAPCNEKWHTTAPIFKWNLLADWDQEILLNDAELSQCNYVFF